MGAAAVLDTAAETPPMRKRKRIEWLRDYVGGFDNCDKKDESGCVDSLKYQGRLRVYLFIYYYFIKIFYY
ncbi:hypothetical protein Lal_00028837 [Lupinus albus]|nr:hypothetical protein Lal_00028837 [Lupinus albus]